MRVEPPLKAMQRPEGHKPNREARSNARSPPMGTSGSPNRALQPSAGGCLLELAIGCSAAPVLWETAAQCAASRALPATLPLESRRTPATKGPVPCSGPVGNRYPDRRCCPLGDLSGPEPAPAGAVRIAPDLPLCRLLPGSAFSPTTAFPHARDLQHRRLEPPFLGESGRTPP